MTDKLSRRSFLKAGLATAGAVAASTVPAPRAKASTGEPLATLIDISKCIGCEACVEGCQEINAPKFPEPTKPFPVGYPTSRVKIADWSEDRDVTDRLTPYNWLFIQTAEGTYKGQDYSLTIPRRCMHCTNPPCVDLCPFGAADQMKNGIVRIDDDVCFGGAKCKKVCPWHIPERQSGVGLYQYLMPNFAGNGVMYKCDRCYDKVAQGKLPECIRVCKEDVGQEVQKIGPRAEIIKEAEAIAKKTGGFLYGHLENGGTNTVYISPVPFEELNKSISKGPGRPHLAKVADTMAEPNKWAAAVALAPIAGALGALGRFMSLAKGKDNQSQAGAGE